MRKKVKDIFEEKIKAISKLNREDQIQSLIDLKKRVVQKVDEKIIGIRKKQDLVKEALRRKKYLKQYKENLWYYVTHSNIRHILSAPFIYSMIIPSVILHIFLEAYHRICFFLYRIPYVDYRDFFVFDRGRLSYLNIVEKINCWYCSYVNGLMSYGVEIAGRTEKYWCPIKHAKRRTNTHKHYDEFFEYLEGKEYSEKLPEMRKFDPKKD